MIRSRLVKKDLKTKTPFNTYMVKGLPPTPISSPGRAAIESALYPANVDYLYFVAKGDGYHTFSKNEKDHERAKRAFQRVRKKVKKERDKAGFLKFGEYCLTFFKASLPFSDSII